MPSRRVSDPSRKRRYVDPRLSTQWVNNTGFRAVYIALIVAFALVLDTLNVAPDAGRVATVTLTVHNLLTFILLHWIKGSPEAGPLDDESIFVHTFWEQLDDGYYGTPSRRFFFAVPVMLFFLTLWVNAAHDDWMTLLINVSTTILVLVPKYESLFEVRLFGINKE